MKWEIPANTGNLICDCGKYMHAFPKLIEHYKQEHQVVAAEPKPRVPRAHMESYRIFAKASVPKPEELSINDLVKLVASQEIDRLDKPLGKRLEKIEQTIKNIAMDLAGTGWVEQ